jgi:V8-like Glu-specific endopeptidase
MSDEGEGGRGRPTRGGRPARGSVPAGVVAAAGRGADRPEDPLFPPNPELLEALRQRRVERAGAAAAGARALDEYAFLIESICGVGDDSQPVEQYTGALGVSTAFVAAHQRPVGQVQWNANLASIYTNPGTVSGVRWGTGTLISDDLFLTAGHLFDQTGGGWERPRANGTTNIIPPTEIATNMRVNFDFQADPLGNMRTEQSFAIVALLEYRLGGLDFAVARLGGNPGATFGRATLSTTDAVEGDMLCIIGHPAGQPKRIEAGPALAPVGNQIRYNDIDTLGGNSGSGVLRASDGRLVGVHTNGGCTAASPAPGGGNNFGMRIAAVIAQSPILQDLTRPKLKIADDPLPTLKFRDDGGGGPKLKIADDPLPTLKFRDDPMPTLKFRDDGGGGPKLKIADDPQPTLKFRDDPKHPALDGGGKHPVLDGGGGKPPGLDGGPIPPPDPVGPFGQAGPGLGGAQPFVLATPHHSTAWAVAAGGGGAEAQAAAAYEAQLLQLEQAMAQHEQALAALDAEYRRLHAAYAAVLGGQGMGGRKPGG